MTDSADINTATKSLEAAIDSLEVGLGSVMSRMKALESTANDSESFREDRLKLARQLDDMAAEAEAAKSKLAARELEFTKITQEGEAELDRVMTMVRGALDRSPGA